jgi:hypothetical protein
MQAWLTYEKSAVEYISAVALAEKTLMSDSKKHELLIINLAMVPTDRNSNSMPA